MKTNPYQPPLATSETPPTADSIADDHAGHGDFDEFGPILQFVKVISIAGGSIMFLIMLIWWISVLLSGAS